MLLKTCSVKPRVVSIYDFIDFILSIFGLGGGGVGVPPGLDGVGACVGEMHVYGLIPDDDGVGGAGVTGAGVTGAGVGGAGVTGAGVTGAGVTGAGVGGAVGADDGSSGIHSHMSLLLHGHH
tara:strand:- start:1126 stop:1491 length:366 start_codon:yes stop_codon:yes gene_type:complete